jgi:hypothetical protein
MAIEIKKSSPFKFHKVVPRIFKIKYILDSIKIKSSKFFISPNLEALNIT